MAISYCETAVNLEGQELAQHGTLSFPLAAYDDDLMKNVVPWHWHEELECAIVTEGRGIIATEKQRAKIEAGDGFFINSGVLHSAWNSDSNFHLHSLVFHASLIGGNAYSVFWESYLNPLLRGIKFLHLSCRGHENVWHREAIRSIERAWLFCESETRGYEFFVREQLSHLVLLMNENLPVSPEISASERRNTERIKTMLLFIRQHFSENLNTKMIASSASISESECLRCFHKAIGTTPIQYLRQYRMRRVEELLLTTDLKISEIANRCGFQEMSYFSRSFREKNALTPTEYRNTKSASQVKNRPAQ